LSDDEIAAGIVPLPYAVGACRTVLSWQPVAVGRRPRDFVTRDLLFGSLSRDRRLWIWRKFLSVSPDWLSRGTATVTPAARSIIKRVRLLHFLHVHHLLRLVDGDVSRDEVVERLLRCWPQGIQVQWVGDGRRSGRDVCRQSDVCPFCLARTVGELHERLCRGPLRKPADRVLALGTVEAIETELPADAEEAIMRFSIVKQRLIRRLRAAAEELGITGGVVTFQIGPRKRERSAEWRGDPDRASSLGYQYRACLLGEATRPQCLLRHLEGDGVPIAPASPGEDAERPRWILRSGPRALRLLLVGASRGYRHAGVQGPSEGAFVVQPWFLANADQWRLYRAGIRNLRLFDAFGTWASALSEDRSGRRQPTGLKNADVRRGAYRRSLAFREANRQRRDTADAACRELAERVRPAWDDLCRQRGTPPGRVTLLATLREIEPDVSERAVRRVLPLLRSVSQSPSDIREDPADE